ncbi:thermonuclease family protein [Shinella daejeonensis]|uniref:thermonuclease family protein n=1 Tax=Shinella daejeonensis TaxID=659017 RepID=UPI0020C75DA0|nr:thermonuclease family protein [Shinella daejeonensis]MCP8893639.1 thermonuclease family protein [Shinella daejeonensis]
MMRKANAMGIRARLRDVGVAIAILVLVTLVVARLGGEEGETLSGIARAADGDTLTLGGKRIRLLGMDAPELAQTCMRDGASWGCGASARARLAELLHAGPVTCVGQATDKYARLLSRCETAAAGDIGARLVREGLAVAYGDYEDIELLARAERAGLWGAQFDMPQAWRRSNGRPEEEGHVVKSGFMGWIGALVGLD